jgi:hypothetical protein
VCVCVCVCVCCVHVRTCAYVGGCGWVWVLLLSFLILPCTHIQEKMSLEKSRGSQSSSISAGTKSCARARLRTSSALTGTTHSQCGHANATEFINIPGRGKVTTSQDADEGAVQDGVAEVEDEAEDEEEDDGEEEEEEEGWMDDEKAGDAWRAWKSSCGGEQPAGLGVSDLAIRSWAEEYT